jgi:hypothetical protein
MRLSTRIFAATAAIAATPALAGDRIVVALHVWKCSVGNTDCDVSEALTKFPGAIVLCNLRGAQWDFDIIGRRAQQDANRRMVLQTVWSRLRLNRAMNFLPA